MFKKTLNSKKPISLGLGVVKLLNVDKERQKSFYVGE